MGPSPRERVIVLQGAGGALGSEVLQQLVGTGAKIAAVVRRRWQIEQIEQKLAVAGSERGQHLVGALDADDAEGAAGFVKGVEDSLGPIAALVSTAGAFAASAFGEERVDAAAALWRANFVAPLTLARAVVIPMRRRRTGALVFTGARAVCAPPVPGMALYLASKAALHTLAEALAVELREHGIHVRVFAPSTLDTAANRAAMPDADPGDWTPIDSAARRLVDLTSSPAGTAGPVVVAD